jgi:hypothetical protein
MLYTPGVNLSSSDYGLFEKSVFHSGLRSESERGLYVSRDGRVLAGDRNIRRVRKSEKRIVWRALLGRLQQGRPRIRRPGRSPILPDQCVDGRDEALEFEHAGAATAMTGYA